MFRKAGASLTRCLHHSLTMSKRLPARRLDGLEYNPWVEFIELSKEYETVNLGQGFPNFPPPDFAVEAFQQAVSEDFMLNQYTMAFGYPPLTKILASFFGKLLGQELDPLENVLVTVGAYGALFTAFQALVDEGDEVIIIEPFFDCYEPMTLMAGGRPVFVSLKPSPTQDGELDSSSNWRLDPTELASKFTSRTKALVLNTPNNPLGKVFSKAELELVARLCQQHDVLCISDEVYQWLVYDGLQHISIASLPGMWARTLTIGSAGKTFSATGWKVGWVLGPDHIMRHLRTVHQNSIFHCPTQGQVAVAKSFEREQLHMGQPSSYFVQLPKAMQRNRDHMTHSLQSVGLKPVLSQGSYFLIADISDFKSKMPDLPGAAEEPYDRRFVKWMIKNKGLVAIPVSIFYSVPHQKDFDHYIRFCFVKDEATLQAMDKKLQKWKAELGP
ncbi:kynurenine--oxoglutarate transaminase 1 isoform X1 [Marmota monax]|uniref:Kynurenine--oxoglutarate transaminase 1 n=1 Tax=Marmota marmota marmota TaxID=9994 RepID=A0A8C5ZJF8_MARMA|nr:kynurenine--oxoglutarate transaminase 1 isoform X1 [Marmota marmota marmota]XP_046307518.1 kynurenine--oxoglutarate transaminase 1 isoform X1 [Marmota monax]